jgi:formylglycine-generating enzyme required for sulfatase activity
LEASGYANRPKDFDDLLRILDGELRLITPTDPEGVEGEGSTQRPAGGKHHQLTHDYLVPSLRDWLTRKQKETRRGRAELLLADRAAVWNARPENRQLPSLWQWCRIRWLTAKKTWTPPQRKMMRKAGRYHAVRVLAVALFLALAGWGCYEAHGRLQARALRDRLLDAKAEEVPAIVREMGPYRPWLDPLLREAFEEADAKQDPAKQLHASLGLLPVDDGQIEYLYQRLLTAGPGELPVIRDALGEHKDRLVSRLWDVLGDARAGPGRRFKAACALATYDPAGGGRQRWAGVSPFVADRLLGAVQQNPSQFTALRAMLQPVREDLIPPLSSAYRSRERGESARYWASTVLADYCGDGAHVGVLAGLLLDADAKQFAVVYPKLREQGEQGLALLAAEIDKKLPADLPSADKKREELAKRQANAAVALLRRGRPEKVWPLLRRSPPDDPRVRSYLIHRLGPLGANAGAIIKRLHEEPDITIRRALLLSLGEFGDEQLPADARDSLLPMLQAIYGNEHDPGLHAAVEWLLRQWNKGDWLKQVNEEWAKNEKERGRRIEAIRQLVKKEKEKTPPQWYVTSQGQAMVVIPGPVEFLMGSPPTEEGRDVVETQHRRRIGRTYALAARPVTVGEFRRFVKESKLEAWFAEGGQAAPLMKRYSPEEDCPIILVDWYRAAAYCNWLSKQEGIPQAQWCYQTDVRGNVTGLKAGYLRLVGYRLPSEAEWEYACRAGAVTSRYYGETEELLPWYGWYLKNSGERSRPVGNKKPNDLGLFDMHGNVYTWCQESYTGAYPASADGKAVADEEDKLQIISSNSRVLRGGSFTNPALILRSAFHTWVAPASRYYYAGFRPARTFAP